MRVRGDELHAWPKLAARLYACRHEVFVTRRGWRALDRGDGFECDDHDGAAADHLIALADDGDILGGLRLLPLAGRRGLLGMARFAIPDDITRSGALELTRFFVRKGVAPTGSVRDHLLAGLQAHCRAAGVRRLIAVVDARLVAHLQRIGLRLAVLAEAARYAEGFAVPVAIAVEPNGPDPAFLSPVAWAADQRRRTHRDRSAAMMHSRVPGFRGGHERLVSAGAVE